VLPGGTTTSIGATRPTRAGAPTCSNQIQQSLNQHSLEGHDTVAKQKPKTNHL